MNICYFGDYDPDYPRNRLNVNNLKRKNKLFICNHFDRKFYPSKFLAVKKFIILFKKHQRIKNQYDKIFVAYSDSKIMPIFAKLISRKYLIWDAFYSKYQTYVFDKKLIKKNTLKAKIYWLIDWLSCKLADEIWLDTDEHIKYFVKTFNISKNKFKRVLVETDKKFFYPKEIKRNDNDFLIHFHGKYIPLQGVEYIIRAAKILEKDPQIKFNLIGSGQEKKRCLKLLEELDLKNINLIESVRYEELADYINKADLCLGIFGNTEKAKMVIPNKVIEALACNKLIITGDTPAIHEINDKNIILCNMADSKDLANKILKIKNNYE